MDENAGFPAGFPPKMMISWTVLRVTPGAQNATARNQELQSQVGQLELTSGGITWLPHQLGHCCGG